MDGNAQHEILQHFAVVVHRHEEVAERNEVALGGVTETERTTVAAQKDLAEAFEAEPSPPVGLTKVVAAHTAETWVMQQDA